MGAAQETPAHEFELRLQRRIDAETGRTLLDIIVETVREFAAYGYRLDLRERADLAGRVLQVELGGVSLPSIATANPGRARGVCTIVMPADGSYALHVLRKQREAVFNIDIAAGTPSPHGNRDGGFIIVVE